MKKPDVFIIFIKNSRAACGFLFKCQQFGFDRHYPKIIKIDPGTASVLDSIGVWAFFVVIGAFSVWVIGTFLTNIPRLKGKEASS